MAIGCKALSYHIKDGRLQQKGASGNGLWPRSGAKKVARCETSGTHGIIPPALETRQILALLQSAEIICLLSQTLHVWLPSYCAFGARSSCCAFGARSSCCAFGARSSYLQESLNGEYFRLPLDGFSRISNRLQIVTAITRLHACCHCLAA